MCAQGEYLIVGGKFHYEVYIVLTAQDILERLHTSV